MKKVSPQELASSTNITLNDALNPEQHQTRCKICFEQKMPLVTLCQCTGSIAYVHEDCILDWIALKMQNSELIQIPKCEICKGKFSAALKIGHKKIDNKLLFQKIQSTTRYQLAIFIASTVAFLVGLSSIIFSVFCVLWGKGLNFQSLSSLGISISQILFLHLGFPAFYLKERMDYFKQKWKIIEACKIQLVEVTLLPKKILKS